MHWGRTLSDREVSVTPLGPPGVWFARAAAKLPAWTGVLTGHAVAFDRDDARTRAFAELVEHVAAFVSGRATGDATRRAAFRDLRDRALSPIDFALAPRATPRVDAVDDATPITWAAGVDVVTGAATWVPALMAHLSWAPPLDEPIFARPSATGLAAQRAAAPCVEHALLEVIERDACGLSWRVPGWPVRAIDRDVLDARWRAACEGLALELFEVGDPDLPARVVIALIHTGDGGRLSVGSACRATLDAACAGAVSEALMVRWTLARFGHAPAIDVPTSSLEHVIRAYHVGGDVVRWYRAQAARAHAAPRATGELAACAAAAFASPIVAVDVCDAQGRASGWHVVRVVAPGAYPRESDGRLVATAHPRLIRALARFADGDDRHRTPHPFG